jgi:signal transduction histidine kinase
MERIIHAVDRQDQLVENLLTLSNPEPESCAAVSIPALLENVVDALPADPRIRVSGDGALEPAWGDAFRLSEVFTNLIRNALDATPASGVVEVLMEPGPPGYVRVSVRNTDAGIPEELRERIFQPFFTTKSRGTGLGLPIARQIVEAHRGSLTMTSDGVSETTFVVDLPTTAGPLAARSSREETLRGERS